MQASLINEMERLGKEWHCTEAEAESREIVALRHSWCSLAHMLRLSRRSTISLAKVEILKPNSRDQIVEDDLPKPSLGRVVEVEFEPMN
ncbi:hypothetical protein Nepgr_015136 [Nepenthes gracilis]|uniref:Uncharacterized protein n=1 Tax=Nepenthes gracilis TaxID=150966 RepID=A0AAD3SKI9_NEPGR|nr:hypothetical protein Nepgr_015136 [Nepenthes gracilis]